MAECLKQGHFFQEFGYQPPSSLKVVFQPFGPEAGSGGKGEGQRGEEGKRELDLIDFIKKTKLEYLRGGELFFPDFLGKLDRELVESFLQQMREFGIGARFEDYDKLPPSSRGTFIVDEVLSVLCFADRRIRQAAYERHLKLREGTNRPRMRHPDDYQLPHWIPEGLLEMTFLTDEEIVGVVRG